MKNRYRTYGMIYSTISILIFIPLLALSYFSIFLFDDPNSTHSIWPVLIAICVFAIPIILGICNLKMWSYIDRGNKRGVFISMIIPVIYPILFLGVWNSAGMIASLKQNNITQDSLIGKTGVFKNGKFNYQITLPDGWRVLNVSQNMQDLFITNVSEPSASESASDKVHIYLDHYSPSQLDSYEEIDTPTDIRQKITFDSGYKGLVRVASSSDISMTVVGLKFDGNGPLYGSTGFAMYDGDLPANFIWFVRSGPDSRDLLIRLANSFKTF